MLPREEYIEQAYFFRILRERLPENVPLQELLAQARDEVLATAKLPLAIDFMLAELRLKGACGAAMRGLAHYFTPFQAYIFEEAEREGGRFDLRLGVAILEREAQYRAAGPAPQGVFLYEFEVLSRHRLKYDTGLRAIAGDSIFDDAWRRWILSARHQLGTIDFADLVYVASQHYLTQQRARGGLSDDETPTILFGEQEGRIALANRKKDPLYLFAAFQRQLGYPETPRPKPPDETQRLLPQLSRRIDQLETRLKLLEDEQRQSGIDLKKFYKPPE